VDIKETLWNNEAELLLRGSKRIWIQKWIQRDLGLKGAKIGSVLVNKTRKV
jgi:hypothetical protein